MILQIAQSFQRVFIVMRVCRGVKVSVTLRYCERQYLSPCIQLCQQLIDPAMKRVDFMLDNLLTCGIRVGIIGVRATRGVVVVVIEMAIMVAVGVTASAPVAVVSVPVPTHGLVRLVDAAS